MATRIRVSIEAGAKRTFASAADWPGWSRSGMSETLALDALLAAAPRYAPIATAAGDPFPAVEADDLEVVERGAGGAGTDFGVPSRPTELDRRPVGAAAARRLAAIVGAAWDAFDRVAAAAPAELRKGPRGGGRDTARIVAHVIDADRAYASEIGIKLPGFDPTDRAAVTAMRESMLTAIAEARTGEPLAGRRWPARYAAHRIAWHALDHAWEIEDRSAPGA